MSNIPGSTIEKAVLLAYRWHDGQVRKHTGLPYFVHPVSVAARIERALYAYPTWEGWTNHFAPIIAAAFLHDVIEDCGIVLSDFVLHFGRINGMEVYNLVKQVSEVSTPDMGNRAHRRSLDAAHYAKSSPAGASIKLADIADNAEGIRRDDQKFWKVYQQEMKDLLPMLKHGHESLYGAAWDQVNNG